MRRLGNVATPATAGTGSPPESLAVFVTLPSLPSVTPTGPVKVLTLFPRESYAVTWTGGLITLSCIAALGCPGCPGCTVNCKSVAGAGMTVNAALVSGWRFGAAAVSVDRKSTRLNSSHVAISYAVFCLKKKILEQRSPFGHIRLRK